MIREKEYHLDGLKLLITLRYDEKTGCYFEEFPDFEEHPVYTSRGMPVVCAAQDACPYGVYKSGEGCMDCGGCRYFYTMHPQELIGICNHPARSRTEK